MALTNKDIARDVAFVIKEMNAAEVEIPSLFRCMAPGLLFIICNLTWFVFLKIEFISFVFFLSIIIFLVSAQMRSKYFSLPETVRQKSLIIRLFKRKTLFYSTSWIVLNLSLGLLVKNFNFDAEPTVLGFMLGSLILCWFIALLDLGRYDVALLSSAIQTWREGGSLDPLLDKK